MSTFTEDQERQLATSARGLKSGVGIEHHLLALMILEAPVKMYRKYKVTKYMKKYYNDEVYGLHEDSWRRFVRSLKVLERQAAEKAAKNVPENVLENVIESEPSVSSPADRKRRQPSPVKTSPAKRSDPWEEFIEARVEEKGCGGQTKEEAMCLENFKWSQHLDMVAVNENRSIDQPKLSGQTLARMVFSQKYNDNKQVPSLFNSSYKCLLQKPQYIQKFCWGAPFDLLEPLFFRLNPAQKVLFALCNKNYLEETEKLFQELCLNVFKKKTLLKKYTHWWQYYEHLSERQAKNEAARGDKLDVKKTAPLEVAQKPKENIYQPSVVSQEVRPLKEMNTTAVAPQPIAPQRAPQSTKATVRAPAAQAPTAQPRKKKQHRPTPMMAHCRRMAMKLHAY